jgi:undecaprenyl-diphosphatase
MDRFHRADGRTLVTRAIAPGIVIWLAIVGLGLLITGPLKSIDLAEDDVAEALSRGRTEPWNGLTDIWSRIGNTEYVIAVCVVAVGLLLWRTRDWRLAAVPAIAISLQATIFVIATHVVGRLRPPVLPLDASPPTSSYPSGHVGASTALYISFLLLAGQRLEPRWRRTFVVAVCAALPLLVGYARLYRGAHHLSDVAVGLLNGLACALLAYGWYRHRRAATRLSRG